MIFLHLPKTGGTSLRNALDPHFSEDEKLCGDEQPHDP